MKIGFVCPRYLPYLGGVETLVRAIAERIAAQGHQVEVLTLVDSDPLPEEERINGVLVRRFKQWFPGEVFIVGLPLYFYLKRHCQEYDVLNAHSYHAMPLFWSSLACPDRLVLSTHYHGKGHSPLANWLHRIYRPFGSWAVSRARRVICASEFEQGLVCTHFHVNEGNTVIIPDGIPITDLQAARPFDQPGVSLIYVGRLEPYKRVDLAITALAHLPQEYRLFVIGRGPAGEQLKKCAQEAEVQDRVRFLENVSDPDLYRWYRTARVLVMMSEAESFPMTSIEALAGGCRVVCNSFPPFTELARQFPGDILIVQETSPQAVAEKVRTAGEIVGRASSDLSAYSWDTVAQITLDAFKDIL